MICQGCMTELSGVPKFCPKCGARIETPSEPARTTKYCPKCGTENPISATFCKKDGYLFAVATTAAPLAPQPAPRAEISDDTPAVMSVEPSVSSEAPARRFPSEPDASGFRAKAVPEMPSPKVPVSAAMARGESAATTEQARVDVTSRKAKPHAKGLLIGVAGLVAVVAAGGGGYWYWSENEARSTVLEAGGVAGNVSPAASVPAVPQGTEAVVAGSAPAASPPQAATPTSIEKPLTVDVARIQQEVNDGLLKAGFRDLYANVNSDGSVNLSGLVASRKKGDEAVRLVLSQFGVERVNAAGLQVVSTDKSAAPPPPTVVVTPRVQPSVATVVPVLKPDPAKLEGDINRALRSGGVGGVTAQVGDDFSVTLKGSATSVAEKNRAFQIARQFKGVAGTRDRVFVVE